MQLDQIKDDKTLMEFLGFFWATDGLVHRKEPNIVDGPLPEQESWGVHIYHLSGENFFSDDNIPANTFMLKEMNGMLKGHNRYLIRTDLEIEKVLSTMPHLSYGHPVFCAIEGSTPLDEWAVIEVAPAQSQNEIVRGLFVGNFEEALNAFVTHSSYALASIYVHLTSKAYKRRGIHIDRINNRTLKNLDHAKNEYNAKRAAIVADHREVMLTVHHANELGLERTESTFSYMRYENDEPVSRARPMKTVSIMLGRTHPKSGPATAIWRTVNDEKPAPYAIYNTDYEVWMLI